MRPQYDGVKFYSVHDWSTAEHLEKASIILDSFNENEDYIDINKVLELYNIQELINSGVSLKQWDNEKLNHYKEICSTFAKVFGKFFAKINNDNFQEISQAVCIGYVEDYWKVFVELKVFKRISAETFITYLNSPGTTLWILLQRKELVKNYGKELADFMRVSEQTPHLIINKFLKKHDQKYHCYFPAELLPIEYEEILQNYISSYTVNLNDLQLLMNAQSTGECPISDKLRLSAKRAYNSYWTNHPRNGVQIDYGFGVEFIDSPDVKSSKRSDNNGCILTYDVKWLLENLDYPTILNNFRYVFDQFDRCWRSNLVSVESHLGILERKLFTRGIKDYVKGNKFDAIDTFSTMQVRGYYDILKSKNVRLEDVLKWFFEEYLPQEFHVHGFRFNPPSEGTTMVEKCRTIAAEMEGVLKQFRIYVQNEEIDRELFEISSEHIVFSTVPSFIEAKYAYGNSKKIQNEQFMLFSDQSHLYYLKETKNKYSSLFDLLTKEDVTLSDFSEYQKQDILWLIERNIIIENTSGYLKLNFYTTFILKDLYEHDVICPQYYNDELKAIIDEWCRNKDLRLTSSLFSEPEQNYLNYELNKSSYSNGLDLRNKYAHSTYPENEKIQFIDYIRLLKIMILVITKINEEFCLREKINETYEEP